jgi:hypothetical protein
MTATAPFKGESPLTEEGKDMEVFVLLGCPRCTQSPGGGATREEDVMVCSVIIRCEKCNELFTVNVRFKVVEGQKLKPKMMDFVYQEKAAPGSLAMPTIMGGSAIL